MNTHHVSAYLLFSKLQENAEHQLLPLLCTASLGAGNAIRTLPSLNAKGKYGM